MKTKSKYDVIIRHDFRPLLHCVHCNELMSRGRDVDGVPVALCFHCPNAIELDVFQKSIDDQAQRRKA